MLKISIYLQNLGLYTKGQIMGKYIDLMPNIDWATELADILVADGSEYEECFISDYDANFDIEINEYTSIKELNALADILYDVNSNYDEDTFLALLEYTGDTLEAYKLLSCGDYTLLIDCHSDEEVGIYLIDEGLLFDSLSDEIKRYLDYEAIGRDYVLNTAGMYTDKGYIF